MRYIYNYSEYLKFTIAREKNLIDLDYDLLIQKLYLSQKILKVMRLKLESLQDRELINFGSYVSHITYKPIPKYRYEEAIGAISYCQYLTMKINKELKKGKQCNT